MNATLLRCAWVAPMDTPPIRDGAVLVDSDVIVSVGAAAELRRAAPHAALRDFGDAVLLPGLVNPHTHLELSHLSPPLNPGRFIDWIATVVTASGDPATAAASVAAGAAQSLRYGVTTVGDIARHVAAARSALSAAPLRAVSFGEVVGMARRKFLAADRIAAALSPKPDITRLKPHITHTLTPHAPYSTDPSTYLACLSAARDRRLPLTTHLAETPDEAAFLSHHAGPFRELWDRLGAWEENPFPPFPGTPVQYAQSLGLLAYHPCALAHVNYCTDADLALLAAGVASVVYCPRTHAYFNHPPHRWREMLSAGVNVAVGTDSRASSPNLNPADDLRLLHRFAPDIPAHTLWQLSTTRAARALGLDAVVGSLTPGKSADVTVFRASTNDPLTEILETDSLPLEVWIAGAPANQRGE